MSFSRQFSLIALVVLLPSAARSAVLRIDPVQGPYTSIQSAVDAAALGDTLDLVPFTYVEGVTAVHKYILIRSTSGPGTTIWDGENDHRMLLVADSRITLQGITFRNGRTTGGGGAIRARRTELHIIDCVLRRNEALGSATDFHRLGGAIYLSGETSSISISGSLFVENQTHGIFNNGGAIAFTRFDGDYDENDDATEIDSDLPGLPSSQDEVPFGFTRDGYAIGIACDTHATAATSNEPDSRSVPGVNRVHESETGIMRLSDCTFLGNVSGWSGSAIHNLVSDVYIDRCLFVANRAQGGRDKGSLFYTTDRERMHLSCLFISWDASPQLDELRTGLRPVSFTEESQGGIEYVVDDPRLCPDNLESMHESSPVFSTEGCGPIGGLPVGCSGPMVLALRTESINPAGAKTIRVYGYGLEEVDSATLTSPLGEVRSTDLVMHVDPWISVTFDVTAADAGLWNLALLRGGQEIVQVTDAVDVLPFVVFAFRDGWIEGSGFHELRLAHHGLRAEYELKLRHESGDESLRIASIESVAPDTLLLRVDSSGARSGIYDLEVTANGDVSRLPGILHVGTPPVLRVPEEYPTISEAIEAAPAGAEIQIAPATYPESIVIDRPLRLRGALGARIDSDQRGIYVSESAGRITVLENLRIENCRSVTGSGAGVWAEAPITMRNCHLYYNHLLGGGNGGGASLAPGSQVISSRITNNSIAENEDLVVTDPFTAPKDVGGGLFCRDCRVDKTQFTGNSAPCVGAAVVTGLFRDNELSNNNASNSRGLSGIDGVAVRGQVIGNYFDDSCNGSSPPTAFIVGPSVVGYNVFKNFVGAMCPGEGLVQLQGAVDFYQNTLVEVALQICTHCQTPPGDEDGIRVYNNIFSGLTSNLTSIDLCTRRLVVGPVFAIPKDRVTLDCNLGSGIAFYTPDEEVPCEYCAEPTHDLGFCKPPYVGDDPWFMDLRLQSDSPALPKYSPIGCADTLGALPVGCGEVPVLVSGAEVLETAQGVEIRWTLADDFAFAAMRLIRDREGIREDLTPEPMPMCRECRFLDRDAADMPGSLEYWLLLESSNGERFSIQLGALTRSRDVGLFLDPVRPNPAQGLSQLSFHFPNAGDARLDLIDVAGRLTHRLWQGPVAKGRTTINLDPAPDLESGVYWVRLGGDGVCAVQRVLVLR